MNHVELEATRRLLFYSVEEAAQVIGNVTPEKWLNWESGKVPIPGKVEDLILDVLEEYLFHLESHIAEFEDKIHNQGAKSVALVWYSFEDYLSRPDSKFNLSPEFWRPQHAICAQLKMAYPDFVHIVKFDVVKYKKWLGTRNDSDESRGEWSTLQVPTNLH